MAGSAPESAREPENISSKTDSLKDQATQAAGRMKDKGMEYAQSTVDKIDQKRDPAAQGLESAASTLHEKADSLPGGEKVSNLAHKTAEKLQGTADYVREHDTRAMVNDVERFVKEHPAQSLAAAAAVGFLVGRAFRHD